MTITTRSASSRPPAVAGLFYPDDPAELRSQVQQLLAAAGGTNALPRKTPKALIAPHAGYVYSGPVAAQAYASLAGRCAHVRRVVLLGPAHRVSLRGLAVPSADAFETPLGAVPVDRDAIALLADLPQVVIDERAHVAEHSLEVHLPFLQQLLGTFSAGAAGRRCGLDRGCRLRARATLGRRHYADRRQFRSLALFRLRRRTPSRPRHARERCCGWSRG